MVKKYKLAILETHPIQYKIPWFRQLHEHPDIDLTVFYCMIPDAKQQGTGFGVEFKWDLPLLEGYNYHVLNNIAKEPGTDRFGGCDCPEIYHVIAGKAEGETARRLTQIDTDRSGEEASNHAGGPDVSGVNLAGRKDAKVAMNDTSPSAEHGSPTLSARSSPAGDGLPSGDGGPRSEQGAALTQNSERSATPGASLEGDPPTQNSELGTQNSSHPSGNRWDAVIINGWVVKSMVQGLRACRKAGVPAILRCEANDLRPRAWWKTFVHKRLIKQFSAFIAIGSSNRDFYVNRGINPGSIFDGFYCIENERFETQSQLTAEERAELRKKWNVPKDAVCFAFSGKFEEKKRPMDILRALREVVTGESFLGEDCPQITQIDTDGKQEADRGQGRQDTSTGREGQGPAHGDSLLDQNSLNSPNSRLHLLMIGDGELRSECEAFAKEHDLPVTFTGFLNQTELPKAYGISDCMILPSDYGETWGLVTNEFMACGCPVIVSDHVGCHPDLIIPGKTGEVFPFGDIDALAETMKRLASDPKKLKRMGDAARGHIRTYSIDNLTKGTLHALRYVSSKLPADGADG